MDAEKEELADSLLAATIQEFMHTFNLEDDSQALKLLEQSIERERAYYEG